MCKRCDSAGGRGAITQIERIAASYKWEKVQPPLRITGLPSKQDLEIIAELGHILAAGVEFGIF